MDGRGLDFHTRLFLSGTLHDRRENLIRSGRKDVRALPSAQSTFVSLFNHDRSRMDTHDDLANVSNSLQCVDPQSDVVLVLHKLQQRPDQFRPPAHWQLDRSDGGDTLGGDRSGGVLGRAEGGKEGLLQRLRSGLGEGKVSVRQAALVGRVLPVSTVSSRPASDSPLQRGRS